MKVYSIGFTKKTAKEFFDLLEENKIKKIIDIRLNNKSQLSGFAKGNDLKYFLKEILDINYEHIIEFSPTKEMLKDFKNKVITWENYKEKYIKLLEKRNIKSKYNLLKFEDCCFLCSENESNYCHRKILIEYLNENKKNVVIHLM